MMLINHYAKVTILIVAFSLGLPPSIFSNHLTGKEPKVKFGKVSEEELKNLSYAPDTTAEAVILYDAGYFKADEFQFTRHVRIKILKTSGTKWGNRVLNTPTKNSIRAYVFNLTQNGEIIKEKVDRSNIYEEQVIEDLYTYKIFAPNVKVGSIIDIKYVHPGLPFEWYFQERIPIVYNELKVEESRYIHYSKSTFGFEPIQPISPNEWRVENMPAFKSEPFLSSYTNYITKFQFQLTSISIPGRYYKEFSTSWEKVGENLMKSTYFGAIIKGSNFLKDKAKEINQKEISIEEKINLAYTYIKENIKWNGSYNIFGNAETKRNFEKYHTGSVGEINLLLISLLNKMNINTKPVVLSTRDNGFIVPYSATFNKLNYVVAYVDHEDTKFFIDASMDHLIPGILPEKCLNGTGQGLVVGDDYVKWLDLNEKFSNTLTQYITITIDKDGLSSAKIIQTHKDYGYLAWKTENDTKINNEEYVHLLDKKFETLNFIGYTISKNEPEKLTLKEIIEADLSEHILDLDDEIIFTPFLMPRLLSNPFKSETRKYPVDLTYPHNISSFINVTIPPDYSVKSIPHSIRLQSTDQSMNFVLLTQNIANNIQLNVQMNITKSLYTEDEYQELKQFYSHMVQKLSESIELTKN